MNDPTIFDNVPDDLTEYETQFLTKMVDLAVDMIWSGRQLWIDLWAVENMDKDDT